MLELSVKEEFDLAQKAIKAGLTPYKCEQLSLPKVKVAFETEGFMYHEMQTLFERWDMKSARAKAAKAKGAKRKQEGKE